MGNDEENGMERKRKRIGMMEKEGVLDDDDDVVKRVIRC